MDRRPVRHLRPDPGAPVPAGTHATWPLTVPAVAQIAERGLELPAGALVLVGENGSASKAAPDMLAVQYAKALPDIVVTAVDPG